MALPLPINAASSATMPSKPHAPRVAFSMNKAFGALVGENTARAQSPGLRLPKLQQQLPTAKQGSVFGSVALGAAAVRGASPMYRGASPTVRGASPTGFSGNNNYSFPDRRGSTSSNSSSGRANGNNVAQKQGADPDPRMVDYTMAGASKGPPNTPYANFARSTNLANEKLTSKEITGLWVRNVPLDMRHEELANLFRQFGTVVSVFLKKPDNAAFATTWAVVKVPGMREALSMLEKLNNTEPFKFRIELAITDEERNNRKLQKDTDVVNEAKFIAENDARSAAIKTVLDSFPKPQPSVSPTGGLGRGKMLHDTVVRAGNGRVGEVGSPRGASSGTGTVDRQTDLKDQHESANSTFGQLDPMPSHPQQQMPSQVQQMQQQMPSQPQQQMPSQVQQKQQQLPSQVQQMPSQVQQMQQQLPSQVLQQMVSQPQQQMPSQPQQQMPSQPQQQMPSQVQQMQQQLPSQVQQQMPSQVQQMQQQLPSKLHQQTHVGDLINDSENNTDISAALKGTSSPRSSNYDSINATRGSCTSNLTGVSPFALSSIASDLSNGSTEYSVTGACADGSSGAFSCGNQSTCSAAILSGSFCNDGSLTRTSGQLNSSGGAVCSNSSGHLNSSAGADYSNASGRMNSSTVGADRSIASGQMNSLDLSSNSGQHTLNSNQSSGPGRHSLPTNISNASSASTGKDRAVASGGVSGQAALTFRSRNRVCIRCRMAAKVRCSVCKASYCSLGCQHEDWYYHKQECRPPPPLEYYSNSSVEMCDTAGYEQQHSGSDAKKQQAVKGQQQYPSEKEQQSQQVVKQQSSQLQDQQQYQRVEEQQSLKVNQQQSENVQQQSPLVKQQDPLVVSQLTPGLKPQQSHQEEKQLPSQLQQQHQSPPLQVKQEEHHESQTNLKQELRPQLTKLATVCPPAVKNNLATAHDQGSVSSLPPQQKNEHSILQSSNVSKERPPFKLLTASPMVDGKPRMAVTDNSTVLQNDSVVPSKCLTKDLRVPAAVTEPVVANADVSDSNVVLRTSKVSAPKPSKDGILERSCPFGCVCGLLQEGSSYTGMITTVDGYKRFTLLAFVKGTADILQEGTVQLEECPSIDGYTAKAGDLVTAQSMYDSSWCRSYVFQVSDNGEYRVCHIDFGYMEIVKNIKPIPEGVCQSADGTGLCASLVQEADHDVEKLTAIVQNESPISFRVISSNNTDTVTVALFDDEGIERGRYLFESWYKAMTSSGSGEQENTLITEGNNIAWNQEKDRNTTNLTECSQESVSDTTKLQGELHDELKLSSNFAPSKPTTKLHMFLLNDLQKISLDVGSRYTVLPVWCEQDYAYVQLATTELLTMFQKLMENIAAHCELASPLETVCVGNLVCGYIASDHMWYRALVVQVSSDGASVKLYFVDFGNTEEVDLAAVRPFIRPFLDVPTMCFKVALGDAIKDSGRVVVKMLRGVGSLVRALVEAGILLLMEVMDVTHPAEDSTADLLHLDTLMVKLFDQEGLMCINDTVGYEDSADDDAGSAVDTASANSAANAGTVASTPVAAASTLVAPASTVAAASTEVTAVSAPVPTAQPPTVAATVPTNVKATNAAKSDEGKGAAYLKYEDCDCLKMDPGEDVDLVILSATNTHTIMVIPQKDVAMLQQLETLSTSMNEYCNSRSVVYYEPAVGEVVLAKFSQDGLWYRAACLTVVGTEGAALVQFVDYGNVETVLLDCLVQMVAQFVEPLPFLALHTVLQGSGPEPNTASACTARLLELLPPFSCVTAATVLPQDPATLTYEVALPAVLGALQDEGLLV